MLEQSDTNPIATIHTSCKNCIFAKYDDNTQVGCEANMWEKFYNANKELIEVYDNDKNFTIINSVCMMKRLDTWVGPGSLTENIVKARQEAQIKYQVVIINNQTPNININTTINSLLRQTILPSHITILNLSYTNLNRIETCNTLQQTGINWKFHNIFDTNFNIVKWLNIIFTKHSFPFVGIFYNNIDIPTNTFEDLDNYVNDKLQSFVAITPNSSKQGLILPYTVYQYFNTIVLNKTLEQFIQENKCQTIPICQLVNNFPK